MRFLLDTNIVSLYAKNDQIVSQKIHATPASALGISVVTLMELEFGIQRNPQLSQLVISRTRTLIREINIVPYEKRDALENVSIRLDLETTQVQRQTKPIGKLDAMIAATARARGLICVTHNTSEFSRVIGLEVQDWTIG